MYKLLLSLQRYHIIPETLIREFKQEGNDRGETIKQI